VRDLTITHLEMCLTANYRWCMCDSGCLAGMPDSLVPKTVRFDPELKSFGNHLVGVLLERALFRVFRSTLQGSNQSVIGLSPLSETTYPTVYEIPYDGTL
jgi:hypothetical protein